MHDPDSLDEPRVAVSAPISSADYYGVGSSGLRFRLRRFQRLLFPLIETLASNGRGIRILDVGGNVQYWEPVEQELARLRCQVTLLNLNAEASHADPGRGRYSFVIGDARKCDLPDSSFDLVHSNSVIEHVGSWRDMRAAAGEIRRLAPSYYIQVPYFWFPLEPHFRVPFFHWLPEQIRARMLMHRTLGFMERAKNMSEAVEAVQSAQLLDFAQMRALFPDATIERERLAGLTKSLIAVRTSRVETA